MSRTAWTYESFESGSDELARYNEYFDTAEDAVRQAVNLVDEYPDTIAGVRKVEGESREDFEHPYKFCIATEENRREAKRVFGGKFVRVSEFCAGLCESNRPRGRMLKEESDKGERQMRRHGRDLLRESEFNDYGLKQVIEDKSQTNFLFVFADDEGAKKGAEAIRNSMDALWKKYTVEVYQMLEIRRFVAVGFGDVEGKLDEAIDYLCHVVGGAKWPL